MRFFIIIGGNLGYVPRDGLNAWWGLPGMELCLMKSIFKGTLLFKSKSSLKILFNYLKTEIVIILILCLGTGLIYGILNRSLKNQIINVNKVLLQNTINSIEKEFSNMNELISLINSNPRVLKFMNIKQNEQNYNAYEAMKDLNSYVFSNKFVKGIYVFFTNNTVISNEYKVDYNFYFEHLNLSGFDVKNLISTYNHRRLVFSKDEEDNLNKLYYVSSLPIGNRKVWNATAVIEVDMDVIVSFLKSNQFTEKTETVLLDSDQTLIIRHNPMEEGPGDLYAIKTSAESRALGWEIVSIIPETEFEAKFLSIKSTIISVLLLSLIVVLIFAVFFAYRHYRPIARLMGIVDEDGINVTNEGIFTRIEESIRKTINENKELKHRVRKQTEYMTDNAVEKLLKKGIIMGNDTDEIIDMSDIKFKSSKLIVLAIKPFITGENINDYTVIISRLQKMLKREQDGYIFYINESNISILMEIINEQTFNPIEFGVKIIKMLAGLNIESTVGIGGICHSVKDLNKSYKEALLSLNALHKDRGEVILYDSIKETEIKTKYYYPVSIEQEIINNVKAGNIEKVKTLLEEVYSENFKEIQLSRQISRILVYNIVSTAIKIMDDLKIDLEKFEDANILKQLYKAETVNAAYSSLISTYTTICQLVNKNKKSSNICLFEKIKQYLIEEYNNPDISLTLIADKFNLSISYLSRFFKENAGINFNDYVQKLRIESAKQIFRQSDNILVEDVAVKVGYNNSSSLIRAFKKYEGITPGEYRTCLAEN